MPPRRKSAEQPAPAPGHNSELTDDALIAENFKLEDLIKAAQAKFDEWAKPHKARIAEIESTLLKRLQDRKAKNTKTDSGTAYISNPMNVKIESREQLFDWIADNWELVGADMKLGIKVEAVRSYMDEHENAPPPGTSVDYFTNLNIKRS